ncbi:MULTISPECIES: spermidine synthase [unclassified Isoptericola]|uniref:spermidine synthase n=1 Tax=unclassified Isoptericola TaxID=2623355 RepID=UPI0027137B7D|nr:MULTISPECIES: fused MFS/spermidine synthase [unclassified Isoptericola]MDO8144652.1 fused MFS/spermidine synthase [Isoptericola sp. 178]MDO8148498.1 fused MFS/spermidine synthase [Isoptericola sp. b515]MDO8151977.1 fused MFS/spermidine synthase [Isoptericola sp. b408]
MAPRSRRARRPRSSREAPTLPAGEVPIDTGTARVETDPEDPERLTLYVNDVPSSCLDLGDAGFLAFEYLQQMAAVVDALPDGPLRAVHLGAAGCALPRYVDHTRPGSRQIGVDVDAELLRLVRHWFELPRSPALRLRADDAGHALAGLSPGLADVVVRDVFAGDTTPDHLVGTAFARACVRAVRPGGVVLANCADRPPLTTARREVAAFAEALGPGAIDGGRLALVAEPAILKGRRYGNVTIVAVAPTPDGETDPDGPPSLDVRAPALGRALRSLAVPAHVLAGEELARFTGSVAPLP